MLAFVIELLRSHLCNVSLHLAGLNNLCSGDLQLIDLQGMLSGNGRVSFTALPVILQIIGAGIVVHNVITNNLGRVREATADQGLRSGCYFNR